MPLAHFTNIDSSKELFEPVYKNLFEVNFILPNSIVSVGIGNLLLENAISTTLPQYPDLGVSEQRFKYSTRQYVMMPDSTSIKDLSIKFNLLKNDKHQVFVFRKLKDWYDLSWNNETGELNYKATTTGTITVNVHDKDGIIIRRVIYHNAILKGFSGWEDIDWSSNSDLAGPLDAKFVVDWWEDYYY